MPIIAIENKSKYISEVELNLIAKACEIQYNQDYAPMYGKLSNLVIATIKPDCEFLKAEILDSPPKGEDEGILAYHFLDENGSPIIRVFTKPILDNGGKILTGANSVSNSFSHETLENDEDPLTNLWIDCAGKFVDKFTKPWKEISDELCDPVEDQSYDIDCDGIAVTVSDFITPDWANVEAKSIKRDFLGVLPFDKPFGMTPNGYVIVRDRPGQEHDIFAETYPTWKLSKKRNPGSRSHRRHKKYLPHESIS